MVALVNGIHVRLDTARQQAAVVLPRLHHYREIRKLCCTVVNIQTVQIVFENALRGFALAPACRGVNLHEHIKCVHQNMTRAHARVDHLDLLRLDGRVFFA